MEDCIRDAEKEENERKRLEQSLAAAVDDDEDDIYQTDDGVRLKKNNKSNKKKNNLKKLSKQKKKTAGATGNEVTDKLFSLFGKFKVQRIVSIDKNKRKAVLFLALNIRILQPNTHAKIYLIAEKHKEVFFTVRLVSQQQELSVNQTEIEDPDALVPSELMDGRDTFFEQGARRTLGI